METTKQNIIDFLKKKIDYLDDLADTNWSTGNSKQARENEDKSSIFEDLLNEIDKEFED
jgi:hypothetical protein